MNCEDFFINFDITNYCNANCPTCIRQEVKGNHAKKDLINTVNVDFDVFKKIVLRDRDFLKNKICKFCGEFGDPMMHPDLEKFIDISSKNFKSVEVATNGSMRSPEWIRKVISRYNNLFFAFAIDGTSYEINSLYRVGVNFNLAFNNMIEGAKVDKGRIHWVFNVFPWNKHQIEEAKKIKNKYGMHLSFRENRHCTDENLVLHKKIYNKWKNEKN